MRNLSRRSIASFVLATGFFARAVPGVATASEAVMCMGREATLVGTEGDDVIFAEQFGIRHPVVHGLGGDDIIIGGNNRDHICGGEGNDYIDGWWGEEVIQGGPGDDTFRGGGFNTLFYGEAPGPVVVDLASGTITGEGVDRFIDEPRRWVLSSFDDVFLAADSATGAFVISGPGNDTLSLGNTYDTARTGAGDDEVHGGGGEDWVWGAGGDDRIYGDGGEDHASGGDGSDYCDAEVVKACEPQAP
ncbi:MAG: calcium-binding protein [Actinomycetota bacterium]